MKINTNKKLNPIDIFILILILIADIYILGSVDLFRGNTLIIGVPFYIFHTFLLKHYFSIQIKQRPQ